VCTTAFDFATNFIKHLKFCVKGPDSRPGYYSGPRGYQGLPGPQQQQGYLQVGTEECSSHISDYAADFVSTLLDFSEAFNYSNATVPPEESASSSWSKRTSSAHSWYAFVGNDCRQAYTADVIQQ
jgi:hypothetical protein